MPSGLKRAGRYGHSYVWGRDQRIPSERYLKNFDKIRWRGKGFDKSWRLIRRPGEGYRVGNRVWVKVFPG